jgi:hypothetical protein
VILKPRIDIYVASILAGGFIALIGFGSAAAIGLYAGLVPAVFGLLGLSLSVVGVGGLFSRGRRAIIIDPTGITLPRGNVFRSGESVHIPRDAIATIAKDESIKGRLIAIALRTGGKVPIQARNYCELKAFLAHCKAHGLPTA